MVELPVAPPTVPVAPEFCWGSIINESKLIIPDIFDAEFGPGLLAWAPPAAPDDLEVGIGPAPKLFTLKHYKVQTRETKGTYSSLVQTKEILESFLFCMYLGFLLFHKWVQLNGKTLQVLKNYLVQTVIKYESKSNVLREQQNFALKLHLSSFQFISIIVFLCFSKISR